MRHALYLAFRSLWWFRGRAITIVLCLGLTLWLPITVRLLLNQFRTDILARAEATPLIIGARGSRIDLVLHGLYFDTAPPDNATMSEADYVRDTGFATAIPLHVKYRTQSVNSIDGVPIVGTSVEYFEFRGLRLAKGQSLTLLGDCVLGADVAERMNLRPGDRILSAPKNAFNLAGDYPLKMNITGILARSHSSDDDVVFVDIRTAWIIDGIGHGHQQLDTQTDASMLLKKDDTSVTASAAVLPFTEITPDNIDSFHFHGDPANFPVSAVIAVPRNRKSQTLLLGRYASVRNDVAQCLKPIDVVHELLNIVFRIEQLVWLSAVLSSIVTAVLLGLVLLLSIRLRAAEMRTMFKLGCSRGTIAMLLGTELMLMLLAGLLLAAGSAWLTSWVASDSLRRILF
ncbi:MAG: ABC transporter permease [Planctomycetaceae bacterium]